MRKIHIIIFGGQFVMSLVTFKCDFLQKKKPKSLVVSNRIFIFAPSLVGLCAKAGGLIL